MDNLYKNNKKQIMDLLKIDERTCDVMEDFFLRTQDTKMKSESLILLYFGLSIISSVVCFFKRIRTCFWYKNQEVLFFSCPDSVFRTKTFPEVAKDVSFSIIYLPTFHLRELISYSNYFKSIGIDAVFWTFSLRDCFNTLIRTWNINNRFDQTTKSSLQFNKLKHQLITYIIYDELIKRKIKNLPTQPKYLLEHQKFFFTPLVQNIRKVGLRSTMLQHGIFFTPSVDYIPLFCDNVICCSDREKRHYIRHGVNPDNAFVLGAPLQTINTCKVNYENKYYDLLLMLTLVNETNTRLIRDVLCFLRDKYPEKKVLLRFRPRSRSSDEVYITDLHLPFDVSRVGTSIGYDLDVSDKVITFSEDTLFEIFQRHNPFVLIRNSDLLDDEMNSKIANEKNYQVYINNLMCVDGYSNFTSEEKKNLIGEVDICCLQSTFKEILNKI